MPFPKVGGSFAPPLDPKTLKEYRDLAGATSTLPEYRDAMLSLCDAVEAHHGQKPSKARGTPHPSGSGLMVPLEDTTIRVLDPHVPWDHEIEAVQGLFDKLPGDSPLRTPAFHLLWYVKELAMDREPMTTDKL